MFIPPTVFEQEAKQYAHKTDAKRTKIVLKAGRNTERSINAAVEIIQTNENICVDFFNIIVLQLVMVSGIKYIPNTLNSLALSIHHPIIILLYQKH